MRYNSKTLEMKITLDQALQKGVEAHKAGQLQEADRCYTAILKANPNHPDANHNMGILAVGVGKVEEALPFFKTAVEANPNITQFWFSYIKALIKLERIADAKTVFEQAKSKSAKGDGFDQIEQRLNTSSFDVKNKMQEVSPTPPNILDEMKLDKALKLANKKVKDGLIEEAKKIYQDILKKFPENKKALDRIKTLASKPLANTSDIKEPPRDQFQNLVNLYTRGQFQEALIQAAQLLEQFPNSINLYNIIGAANKGLGKLEKAIEAYSKALSIKPDYADAYNNMGNALQEQGKLEEAIESHKKVLSIKPDYAEAYYNMGNALKEQGKPDEAIDAFTKALSIKPDYAEANNNIGIVLQDIIFTQPNGALQKTIVSLLDKATYVRPNDIAKAAISLLKFEPALQKHLQLGDGEIIQNPIDIISDINEFPLLLKLMSFCPLPDLQLEKLLRDVRHSILLNILSLEEVSVELLRFQSALALQCFTNEYIYSTTEEEEKILQSLEANIKKALKNKDQPSPQAILALASYKALNEYDWRKLLVITDHIKDVVDRQVEEPNQEEKLKQDLPILEQITDNISSEVRAQYEESPYPRWVNLGLPLQPLSISNVVNKVKLKLYDNRITEVEEPDVLIAGCGTGQHSIGTAARFKGSKVQAIDLSLSSLAYAKRKTDELSIENIEYLQADILDLGQLNKQFDIIESGGVLHHMEYPMAGWKVLTDCLKPGGLMQIGLYSELARQKASAKIRNEISELGIGSSDAEMKLFREIIIKSEKVHHKLIREYSDFYSLSTLRDLLFHVQEHRFTILQIKDCLDKLGLKFCGFESSKIVSNFKQTNKNKNDPYDLDKWQAYEEANPTAFAGMYQFWCQKAD